MENTKNALLLLGVLAIAALWAVGHAWFWSSFVGGLTGLFGGIFTSAVLPLLGVSLYQDWKEPKP